jgi:hypothetical protein
MPIRGKQGLKQANRMIGNLGAHASTARQSTVPENAADQTPL